MIEQHFSLEEAYIKGSEKTSQQPAPTTIKDIASLAGVSPTTISHALNGTRPVAESTKIRIAEITQTINYIPDIAGRNLGRSAEEGSKDKGKSTMKDVAKRSGVSITTVSHVLNATRYVAEETKKKVLNEAAELGYKINPDAQSLRKGKKPKTTQPVTL